MPHRVQIPRQVYGIKAALIHPMNFGLVTISRSRLSTILWSKQVVSTCMHILICFHQVGFLCKLITVQPFGIGQRINSMTCLICPTVLYVCILLLVPRLCFRLRQKINIHQLSCFAVDSTMQRMKNGVISLHHGSTCSSAPAAMIAHLSRQKMLMEGLKRTWGMSVKKNFQNPAVWVNLSICLQDKW